jgi:hypothetical protein
LNKSEAKVACRNHSLKFNGNDLDEEAQLEAIEMKRQFFRTIKGQKFNAGRECSKKKKFSEKRSLEDDDFYFSEAEEASQRFAAVM